MIHEERLWGCCRREGGCLGRGVQLLGCVYVYLHYSRNIHTIVMLTVGIINFFCWSPNYAMQINGHLKRWDDDYNGQKGAGDAVAGKRKAGKAKEQAFVVVKEEVGAREDEVFDRSLWRICCDDPWWEMPTGQYYYPGS